MKIYKTTTILLSIALIGVLIFIGFFNSNREQIFIGLEGQKFIITQEWVDEVLDHQKISNVDKLEDDWMKRNYVFEDSSGTIVGTGIHPSKTGSFIDLAEAKRKYARFVEINRKLDGEKWISPYAFAFGLDNLKSLIRAIDKENLKNDPTGTFNVIRGVRAYLVVTKDQKTLLEHYDLMMIPVQGDGIDYIQIDTKDQPIFPDSLFLNTSAPCPNNCDPPGK
ncbi:hypothetical protein ACV07N_08255 [Roseivirga echinicomitans]